MAASVGEFLPLGHFDGVVMFSVLGMFTYLNLFDFLRMFTLLGIFNFLGFVFVRNIVPYQKSVILTHPFLAQRDYGIDVDSFIVRGMYF